MSKFERDTSENELCPEDLVVRAFSRCSNYPKEREGVLGLAQGLRKAATRFKIAMEAIVEACTEASTYCPTDSDLINVARALKPQAEKQVGPRICPYTICDGTGWRETWNLHTHYAGDGIKPAWVEKKAITLEQYEDLSRKVDWKTQMAFAGRYRCKCHPPRDMETPKERKRKGSLEKVT